MVAFGADEVRDPVERDAGERVVAADGVQENEHRHEKVGRIGKPDAPKIEPNQGNDDAQDGDVLGDPRGARDRMKGQEGEFGEIKNEQHDGPAGFHAIERRPMDRRFQAQASRAEVRFRPKRQDFPFLCLRFGPGDV